MTVAEALSSPRRGNRPHVRRGSFLQRGEGREAWPAAVDSPSREITSLRRDDGSAASMQGACNAVIRALQRTVWPKLGETDVPL